MGGGMRDEGLGFRDEGLFTCDILHCGPTGFSFAWNQNYDLISWHGTEIGNACGEHFIHLITARHNVFLCRWFNRKPTDQSLSLNRTNLLKNLSSTWLNGEFQHVSFHKT